MTEVCMRKIFCDVCGVEIPEDEVRFSSEDPRLLSACPGVRDLCGRCFGIGQSLEIEEIVLARWREKLGSVVSEPEPAAWDGDTECSQCSEDKASVFDGLGDTAVAGNRDAGRDPCRGDPADEASCRDEGGNAAVADGDCIRGPTESDDIGIHEDPELMRNGCFGDNGGQDARAGAISVNVSDGTESERGIDPVREADIPAPSDMSGNSGSVPVQEDKPAPKRRGRKPKPRPDTGAEVTLKRRGRKPKAVSTAGATGTDAGNDPVPEQPVRESEGMGMFVDRLSQDVEGGSQSAGVSASVLSVRDDEGVGRDAGAPVPKATAPPDPVVPGAQTASVGRRNPFGPRMDLPEATSEKSRAFRALFKYRHGRGIGSLQELAEKAGVETDQLRRALLAERFDIAWWRKVEAGLRQLAPEVLDT